MARRHKVPKKAKGGDAQPGMTDVASPAAAAASSKLGGGSGDRQPGRDAAVADPNPAKSAQELKEVPAFGSEHIGQLLLFVVGMVIKLDLFWWVAIPLPRRTKAAAPHPPPLHPPPCAGASGVLATRRNARAPL